METKLTRLVGGKVAKSFGAPGKTAISRRTPSVREACPERIELGGLLIRLIERCRSQVGPGITLGLNARLGCKTVVDSQEADALEFVFCEIVSNAYRYAHPAGLPVEVTVECRVGRKGKIVIDIGDDGVGLSPDFAEW